ncbi:unnamed protein product [Strongylus vulgaris]|uniref:Receptor ligand binding region domain-containing protein n=1 Tax=Strongylus vulgaris TaxID=40348 RepID=A0A3P7IKP2_STRVU|nr:unnamed protein product [Strongylus vulgaris]
MVALELSMWLLTQFVRITFSMVMTSIGYAIELIRDFNVDVIIGPTCNVPAIAVAAVTAFYNIPLYTWGFTTANELADTVRFPTCIVLTPNYLT